MSRAQRTEREGGFTLLEVMIALAILAVAAAGFSRVAVQSAQTADYLTQKTLASVVAANTLYEMQQAGAWPGVGRSERMEDMVNARWRVTVEVTATTEPALRRVEVSVGREEGRAASAAPLYRLTGFLGEY